MPSSRSRSPKRLLPPRTKSDLPWSPHPVYFFPLILLAALGLIELPNLVRVPVEKAGLRACSLALSLTLFKVLGGFERYHPHLGPAMSVVLALDVLEWGRVLKAAPKPLSSSLDLLLSLFQCTVGLILASMLVWAFQRPTKPKQIALVASGSLFLVAATRFGAAVLLRDWLELVDRAFALYAAYLLGRYGLDQPSRQDEEEEPKHDSSLLAPLVVLVYHVASLLGLVARLLVVAGSDSILAQHWASAVEPGAAQSGDLMWVFAYVAFGALGTWNVRCCLVKKPEFEWAVFFHGLVLPLSLAIVGAGQINAQGNVAAPSLHATMLATMCLLGSLVQCIVWKP